MTHQHGKDELERAVEQESALFKEYYAWIHDHMPSSFFEHINTKSLFTIVHSLIGFEQSNYFAQLYLKDKAFVLSLDHPTADLTVLKQYREWGIKNYRCFVSNTPPPISGITARLRISIMTFTHAMDVDETPTLPPHELEMLIAQVKQRNPTVSQAEILSLIKQLGRLFLQSMTLERLIIAIDLFFRAKSKDNCQYEVKRNELWQEKQQTPSLQVILAWRNVPKYNFLYRLSAMVYRHGLSIIRVNATYIDPHSQQNILLLSIGLHGMKGGAAWDEADVDDFLKELVTLKYFQEMEGIETTFVETKLLSGNLGNLIKTIACFVHQALVPLDPNLYTLSAVEEGFCRHPELTVKLSQAFEAKFHPQHHDLERYHAIKEELFTLVRALDTGNLINDTRRKHILTQAMQMIEHTLKTNFYRKNKTAFSYRLDPHYLDHLPFDRKEKFPELPFAIFFMKGFYFTGFHIRFRDLSRGGLRTVFPSKAEQVATEKNNIFSECYNLAYTQNKKNKDIPEGGAKGVIFLEPYPHLLLEEEIYKKELHEINANTEWVEKQLERIAQEQKLEYLYQAQRAYIESFVTIINCEADGTLRAKDIVDYWKKPEYIYLGPDENMHNVMLEWIAGFSKHYHYKPGGAFISSKPGAGINHKEFGVTSLGVNVYVEEVLKFMGINPYKQPFTIKMSGGPDGDVAGNEMANLYKFYPHTAKLLATIDISGTIFDPQGLNLKEVYTLFEQGKPLCFYPAKELHDEGFLVDTRTKKEESAYVQKTLCYKKIKGKLTEEWISGNEMNAILRHNVHQVQADLFVPGGGRPRTLNENNYKDFLNSEGKPTARAIVEGANLYLTPLARQSLEKLGVLIIKDSSANKGGVICSSFEVLCSLVLSEEQFLQEKNILVPQILKIIEEKARQEAKLLLKTHQETGESLSLISDQISERINHYKDQLFAHLQTVSLSNDLNDPLVRTLLKYAPPLLRAKYPHQLLSEVPDIHKKAIIACHIASTLIYSRGLQWGPSVADILPLIIEDPAIVGE